MNSHSTVGNNITNPTTFVITVLVVVVLVVIITAGILIGLLAIGKTIPIPMKSSITELELMRSNPAHSKMSQSL